MNQSAVRSPRDATRAWRMRAWPGDDTVAHLIFVDHNHVPTAHDIRTGIDHAARRGARAIRTSALFPDAARPVLAEGFEPIDRLALLRIALDRGTDDLGSSAGGDRLHAMRPWHLTPCARVDRAAFGLMWGNTASSLRDIHHATPSHRSRVARSQGTIVGFAISGAAGDTGYVQRVAVAPEHRRRGTAHRLVVDALEWMRRRRLAQALVNTGVANDAALALYDSIGFVRLQDELTIAELKLAES